MQHVLANKLKGQVTLNRGIHQALDDFYLILGDIANFPIRIIELVPPLPLTKSHHDASGCICLDTFSQFVCHLVPRTMFETCYVLVIVNCESILDVFVL